jgi:hypothetical protein
MSGYIISDKKEINIEDYEIQNFNILRKTNLNIFVIENNKVLYKNYIINNASLYGHVQVLEWFKNSGYEFNYGKETISNASKNGHVEVLEWFKHSGYEFKYDHWAINYTSEFGHIQVLEWFKNSGYEFKYNNWAICLASKYGHVQVLEWFKNSGYEFKYDDYAINYASYNGHVQVLEWFKNFGYKFKYMNVVFKSCFKILKFYYVSINVKKLIKLSNKIIFIKTVKFKTRNKYLKGYQKN